MNEDSLRRLLHRGLVISNQLPEFEGIFRRLVWQGLKIGNWRSLRSTREVGLSLMLLALLPTQILRAAEGTQEQPARARTQLTNNVARALRYFPENGDFVITNGTEFFNRPLYCEHSAYRIDGGDRPEFSFYQPGHGGNLRLGLRTVGGAVWLD